MNTEAAQTNRERCEIVVDVEKMSSGRFWSEAMAAGHRVGIDQPAAAGGLGAGPNPFDLLFAAFGGCTVMTLTLFADERRWPLNRLRLRMIHVRHPSGRDTLERVIELHGDLDDHQRAALLEAADRSPVQALLNPQMEIVTRLGPVGDPEEAARQVEVSYLNALSQALRSS